MLRNCPNRPKRTVIPNLPRKETIDAIKQKTQANKTYLHGQIRYAYLLSRTICCKHCGYAMFGQTNHKKTVIIAMPIITQGKLDFGPWERIFYGEFDGKRKKRLLVKIIGE